MKNFPDLPPVWTVAAIGTIHLLNWIAPYYLFDFPFPWIAYSFQAIGGLSIVWSALWFYSKKTTIEPHHSPTILLVEGPFKISRNPIYLGLVSICFGSVLNAGNVLGFLPFLVLIWALQKRFVIPEEQGLLKAFGKEAEDYIASTSRWLL